MQQTPFNQIIVFTIWMESMPIKFYIYKYLLKSTYR